MTTLRFKNERTINHPNECMGHLWIQENKFGTWDILADTLQPPVGYKNELGYAAIPAHRYTLIPYFSPKFGYIVPLFDVDISTQKDEDSHRFEIHPMNTFHDTQGCTGLGKTNMVDAITASQDTWKNFMSKYFLPATRIWSKRILIDMEKEYLKQQIKLGKTAAWELILLEGLSTQLEDNFITIDVIDKF